MPTRWLWLTCARRVLVCNPFRQGLGPYATAIKSKEKDLKDLVKKINDMIGVKESDTGLAQPSMWDTSADK